jgi:hypothetical protein
VQPNSIHPFFDRPISPCSLPHFRQIRFFDPSAKETLSRDAFPQAEQKNKTFDALIGISLLSRPPCGFF